MIALLVAVVVLLLWQLLSENNNLMTQINNINRQNNKTADILEETVKALRDSCTQNQKLMDKLHDQIVPDGDLMDEINTTDSDEEDETCLVEVTQLVKPLRAVKDTNQKIEDVMFLVAQAYGEDAPITQRVKNILLN